MQDHMCDVQRKPRWLVFLYDCVFIWGPSILVGLCAFFYLAPSRDEADQEEQLDAQECRMALLHTGDSTSGEDIHRCVDALLLRDQDLAFVTANELAASLFEGNTSSSYTLFQIVPSLADRFVQQSRSEDFEERLRATIALGRARGQETGVVDALIERLADDDDIAMVSIQSLGLLRSDAQAAIPRLVDLVRQERGPLREAAARSIVKISSYEAKKLVKELKDRDPEFSKELEEMILYQSLVDRS